MPDEYGRLTEEENEKIFMMVVLFLVVAFPCKILFFDIAIDAFRNGDIFVGVIFTYFALKLIFIAIFFPLFGSTIISKVLKFFGL